MHYEDIPGIVYLEARTTKRGTMDEDYISKARMFAIKAHGQQRDKSGRIYITHPKRVAQRMEELQLGEDVIAAAWLHDVLEDTEVTVADLEKEGFHPYTIELVKAMTKPEGIENLYLYYDQILNVEGAVHIKLADIYDNLDPIRMKALPESTRNRLLVKYGSALMYFGIHSKSNI